MKHRGVDYSVMQGIERKVWKWRFEHDGKAFRGQAETKADADKAAQLAINRKLGPEPVKKLRLVPPKLG